MHFDPAAVSRGMKGNPGSQFLLKRVLNRLKMSGKLDLRCSTLNVRRHGMPAVDPLFGLAHRQTPSNDLLGKAFL